MQDQVGMSIGRLARRGLVYFRRYHATLFLGTALSSMILTGALLVGDSVKRSLSLYAEQRLGGIGHAVNMPRRFVDSSVVDALSRADQAGKFAGVLHLRGALSADGSGGRTLGVNVLGVDEGMWRAGEAPPLELGRTSAALNERAAKLLGVGAGDIVSITVERPSLLSRDAPLSSRAEDSYARVSLKVTAVVSDDDLGKFSLKAEQVPALNVFVNRIRLQELTGLDGKVNLILASKGTEVPQETIRQCWQLEHSGYSVSNDVQRGEAVLKSGRVFIEPHVVTAAEAAGGWGQSAYLVNEIISAADETRSVPYSFALAGAPKGILPEGIGVDEAVVNEWLAKELRVSIGDSVRVKYFRLAGPGDLKEETHEFRIGAILPMSKAKELRGMMPEFPGLSDVESCSDWDIGMPLDEAKVEDPRNEEYWEEFRDTPRLYITLEAGKQMWGNRFGSLTSLRFPLGEDGIDGLRNRLEIGIDPIQLGLGFVPVAERADQAVSESMSFGGLFIGLSFFVIVAALLLTSLLYSFTVARRSVELGVLRSCGYSPKRAGQVFLMEAAAVAIPGALFGALCAGAYTQMFLRILNDFWSGAVAGSIIVFDWRLMSVLAGAGITAASVLAVVARRVRKLARMQAVDLVSGRMLDASLRPRKGPGWLAACAGLAIAAILLVVFAADTIGETAVFFGSGALALVAGIMACRYWIDRLGTRGHLSAGHVGLRNAARRHERSMSIVVLMAIGCFLVIAVACMKEDPSRHAGEKWSGTGGFDLIVEFAVPIQRELLTAEGLADLGISETDDIARSTIVPLKVRDGDDASCLNLNKAQVPVVLGVDAELMGHLGAFGKAGESARAWKLLSDDGKEQVPVLSGDKETVQWGLGLAIGDSISLAKEDMQPFEVALVGALPLRRSILQGRIVMDIKDFVARYPSEAGYQMLLIACPEGRRDEVMTGLQDRFKKFGPTVTPSVERLAQLYAVENTYMGMFGALGGLGLLIGSLGVGIVAALSIMQRRSELGLLRALGYRKKRAAVVVFAEYSFLFVYGVTTGTVAALVAVWPNLRESGTDIPVTLLSCVVVGTLAAGCLSIFAASRFILRAPLLDALRQE